MYSKGFQGVVGLASLRRRPKLPSSEPHIDDFACHAANFTEKPRFIIVPSTSKSHLHVSRRIPGTSHATGSPLNPTLAPLFSRYLFLGFL